MSILSSKYYERRTHVVPAAHPRLNGTVITADTQLQLVVHEYLVHDAPIHGHTWVMTHGTSFNKDLWQAIIDDLLVRSNIRSATRRIFAVDAVNHGDSAILNKSRLTQRETSYKSFNTSTAANQSLA
ncbi:hypothetical protein ANO11243_071350 [Dothideomycetidae sp. 11243]|nr:hypothetical protein ANO11243_071350 [fungal sp. No.11243]